MKFRRLNRSPLVRRDVLRVEIKYYADGGMESRTQHKEGEKWESVVTTYGDSAPTWETLHKCAYIGKGDGCFQPPWPVLGTIIHMKYVAHCMELNRKRATGQVH